MVPPYDKMSSSNQNPYFWVKGVGYGKKAGVFQTTRSSLTIDTGCRLPDRSVFSPLSTRQQCVCKEKLRMGTRAAIR